MSKYSKICFDYLFGNCKYAACCHYGDHIRTSGPDAYYSDTHFHLDRMMKKDCKISDMYSVRLPPSFKLGITNFIDPYDWWKAHDLLRHEKLFGTMGIHPSHATRDKMGNIVEYLKELKWQVQSCDKIIAIGECGLDGKSITDRVNRTKGREVQMNQERCNESVQIQCFVAQLEMAKCYNKPVVIHMREKSYGEPYLCDIVYNKMKEILGFDYTRGIHLHCFISESFETAERWLKFKNLKFGLTNHYTKCTDEGKRKGQGKGTCKHKDTNGKELVSKLPLDKILLETDAPYFAVPGSKRSYSVGGDTLSVAHRISEIKNMSIYKVLAQTLRNAEDVYDLSMNTETGLYEVNV